MRLASGPVCWMLQRQTDGTLGPGVETMAGDGSDGAADGLPDERPARLEIGDCPNEGQQLRLFDSRAAADHPALAIQPLS